MMSAKLSEHLVQAGYQGLFNVSDLITDMGFCFHSLERVGPTRWRAQSFATKEQIRSGRLIGDRAEGITAEDALARLWLAQHANGDASA